MLTILTEGGQLVPTTSEMNLQHEVRLNTSWGGRGTAPLQARWPSSDGRPLHWPSQPSSQARLRLTPTRLQFLLVLPLPLPLTGHRKAGPRGPSTPLAAGPPFTHVHGHSRQPHLQFHATPSSSESLLSLLRSDSCCLVPPVPAQPPGDTHRTRRFFLEHMLALPKLCGSSLTPPCVSTSPE